MALLFIEGFAGSDWATKWSAGSSVYAVGTTSPSGPTAGSYRARLYGAGVVKNITASDKLIVGAALYFTAYQSNTCLQFKADSGAVAHITIMRNTAGQILIRRGTTSGTILATSAQTISDNVWNYLEVSCTISDTVGEVHVRMNGGTTDVVSFTGDTRNGGTSQQIDAIVITTFTADLYMTNIYVCNDTGTVNNDFLGEVAVGTLRPNANGNSSLLTGSDADQVDNYLLVDETPYSSSDYTASSTPGDKDTYGLEDLPAAATTVYGIQVNTNMRKDDVGTAEARAVLRSAGTDYTGDTHVLTTSATTYMQVYEEDPATSTGWTTSGVNSAEAGMEVV